MSQLRSTRSTWKHTRHVKFEFRRDGWLDGSPPRRSSCHGVLSWFPVNNWWCLDFSQVWWTLENFHVIRNKMRPTARSSKLSNPSKNDEFTMGWWAVLRLHHCFNVMELCHKKGHRFQSRNFPGNEMEIWGPGWQRALAAPLFLSKEVVFAKKITARRRPFWPAILRRGSFHVRNGP